MTHRAQGVFQKCNGIHGRSPRGSASCCPSRSASVRAASEVAPRWRVTMAALGDPAASVGVGILSGLLVTLWAADIVRNQLFGVQPDDVPTLAAACAVVVVSALVAAYGPARRRHELIRLRRFAWA